MQTVAISKKPTTALPIFERYGVTVQVAAQYIGISRSRIYELLAAGDLEGKIIHGRRIVIVESMLRMLGASPVAKRETAA
jgi:excisionase family DNA binding protein